MIDVSDAELGSHEQMLAQFETNLFGPMKVTRAVLPYMRQRRSGTLVFIGSLSGWVGHKGITPYASSKHALEGKHPFAISSIFECAEPFLMTGLSGAVESLRLDVAPFGISTLLVEPGRFRTTLLSDQNLKATGSTIGDYAEAGTNLREGLAAEDRRQPGDPVKLVEIVLDVVRGEGVAQGREMPFRLPLGTDCYEEVRGKCQETLRLLEEWKAVGLSTDF
jgi:NAD(P)-dependent dehydrogenase (short-subunit alcohol dehydrogenase family)